MNKESIHTVSNTDSNLLLKKFEKISNSTSELAGKDCDHFEYLEYSGIFPETKYEEDFRLGQLLIDFNLITQDLLNEALEEAKELGIPLGRVLVMSGWVTQKQLNWVVRIQAILKEDKISKQMAIQIADLINSSNLTLEQAFETTGVETSLNDCDTKLGDLLLEAHIVSADELETAINKSQCLGLPLGRFLNLTGLISSRLLDTAINAQKFARQGKITRDDAIFAIRRAHLRYDDDPNSSKHLYCGFTRIKLGELLCLAGILSEPQVEYAVELGLINNMPVGKVLVDLGLLSEETLENALLIQVIVSESNLSPKEAAYALIDIHYHGYSITKALNECTNKKAKRRTLPFKEFIATTGILNKHTIDNAMEDALASPYIISKALLFTGVLDESTMQLLLCTHFYLRENMLSFDEAMMLFSHACRNNISIGEAIDELNMDIRLKKNPAINSNCINEKHWDCSKEAAGDEKLLFAPSL